MFNVRQDVGGLSAISDHWLAARRLPAPVKRVLPPGVLRGLQEIRNQIRKRLVSRTLSTNAIFEQPKEEQQSAALISIVVPIRDAPLVTRRCLSSLERNATNSEIILIDDGSQLAESQKVVREFSERNEWKTRRNDVPLGHSAACAAGASLASRRYLCLLNSDTVVTHRGWQNIVTSFESSPSVGVAGPSTSASGNEQTLQVAALCRLYWNDNQICAFADKLRLDTSKHATNDVPWISGFALFIRRSLWEELGGFDRKLPDYGNEIELCKRVRDLGYRTVWVRNSYIHHLGRQSYARQIGQSAIDSRIAAAYQYILRKHRDQPARRSAFRSVE